MSEFTALDEFYMNSCFMLAAKGLGFTRANPMVGCVIVHNNEIIGKGYHTAFGKLHAEREAIASVKENDRYKLGTSTLYVNLEPCCHFGKTPPCTDAIIEAGIQQLIISNTDPFQEVNGKGVELLQSKGIDVRTGLLEENGRFLNRRFFTMHELKRPYIILKWAESNEGNIASNDKSQKWLSGAESKSIVHQWRTEEMAIMVGFNTLESDNPQLTAREVDGVQPLRISYSRDGHFPKGIHLLDNKIPSLLFYSGTLESGLENKIDFCKIDKSQYLTSIFDELYRRNVSSIIIEGGPSILYDCILNDYWDEARVFQTPTSLKGIAAPKLNKEASSTISIGEDKLSTFFNS